MHGEHSFNWLHFLPVVGTWPIHVAGTVVISAVLLICGMVVGQSVNARIRKQGDEALIPDSRLSFLNFFEIVAEKLYGLTELVIGKENAPHFTPFIGSLFIFIFTSNLVGLIPGFLPPTDNLNTTIALGVFVFLYYNFIGLKENGIGYLKHFLGPLLWLSPLMLVIELASHIFRPLSLGLRLRGNIMGDHVVLGIFSELIPYLLPVIFYGLGVFVAFVQALVFCLLTMVYISLSTAHDH